MATHRDLFTAATSVGSKNCHLALLMVLGGLIGKGETLGTSREIMQKTLKRAIRLPGSIVAVTLDPYSSPV